MSQKMIKNRDEFYKLVAIEKKEDGNIVPRNEFEIEGRLEDHVVISVPPTMTERSVRELLENLSKKISAPVIVVTHNISFLKARRMTAREVSLITHINTTPEIAEA